MADRKFGVVGVIKSVNKRRIIEYLLCTVAYLSFNFPYSGALVGCLSSYIVARGKRTDQKILRIYVSSGCSVYSRRVVYEVLTVRM